MTKLNNFPTSYYLSLEESTERQKNIEKQFLNYGIHINSLISKRFSESEDVVTGEYLYQLNSGTAGCCVSHLKAIKEWYDNYDDDYAFFCEDDLSLETIPYWDFTWQEFINSLPGDWDAVQLLTIRKDFGDFKLRERYWDDWSATAYIIKRKYAKILIDTYIKGNEYCLEIPNSSVMPLIENILFTTLGKTYTVPLFVEEISFESTFSKDQDDDVNAGQKNNHYHANKQVLEYWKGKFIDETIMINQNESLQNLITEFSLDTENALNNFKLGVWYENNGHTAPGLSYFLRCAERSENEHLAYEALIRASYCYQKQGTRDGSAKSLLEQALCLIPSRPEAYFLLSRFAEVRQWWQDCYIQANNGLMYADFESHPDLITDVEYPGKYGLLYEKSLAAWWWGKSEESKEILLDLIKNYPLTNEYRSKVESNLRNIGVDTAEYFKPIPVIGVPIVNGIHWLQRLIDSIDYPVNELCVINNNGRGELDEELEKLSKSSHRFIKKITVCNLPSNIGCSGAWNLIIKSYMMNPYWIIASHDIAFTPGFLDTMVRTSEKEDVGVVKGKEFQWDLFLIKDWVIQECGLFDENFYPAYVEDCDYHIRLMLKNIKTESLDNDYLHGDVDYKTSGSQTWRTDLSLKEKVDYSHDCNMYYIAEKWGNNWRDSNWEYHPHQYPYNNPSIPITYTTYDLKFVRRKNMGF